MRSFLIQIPSSIKFQLSNFKQSDCPLDTLEKLFVVNIINHQGLLFGRKSIVEVSACSCLQCVWGGSVFMHCFLLIWYQQLLRLRLNLRGPVDSL